MKLYFDNIIFSLQKAGGISLVWSELLKNINNLNKENTCFEYKNAKDNLFYKEINLSNFKIRFLHFFNKILSQFIKISINEKEPFIFHSSYFRLCNNPKAVNITTVHDFIYEQSKMSLKQKFRIYLDYKVIRKSDAIVCVSENTKNDLIKYIPTIDKNKIYVIYNGVSEDYYKIEEKIISKYKNFILFVGSRNGYKNFDFAINAIANTNFNLLIVGKPLIENELKVLNRLLPNRYECISFPSNGFLNVLYNSVYCLLYPSSYEGFGLPILEAQKAGCPVIALNKSSIPEIIGNKDLLISELDDFQVKNNLYKLQDPKFRNYIIQEGIVNSRRFSWEKMAEQYYQLYNNLLSINQYL